MDTAGLPDELTYYYLSDADAARNAVDRLLNETIIGLDTETYWDVKASHSRVSLVQVATLTGEVVVIDALAMGFETLRPVIESPTVMMAAHNARFDEMVLIGEGIRPVGFIDTLRLARMALDLPSYSLAAVSEHLFGITLDKSLQKSNWRRRPLTGAQIAYAATDALMTLRVYEELQRTLGEQGKLERAMRASMLSGDTRPAPRKRRTPHLLSPPLTAEEKRAVAHLKKWRLELAQNRRVPVYMICPDRTLEHLVREQPATLEALNSIYGLGESKIANFGEELLNALRGLSLRSDEKQESGVRSQESEEKR